MRILMVTDFYEPYVGGVEVVVRSLARELSARGHSVSVATLRMGNLPQFEEDGPVRVHRIRTSASRLDALFSQQRPWAPPIPDPEATLGIRRVMAIERPEIVHGHDWLARSFLPLRRSSSARLAMSLHYYTTTCAKKTLMYRGAPCTGPSPVKCMGCAGRHYGRAKGAGVAAGNFLFAAMERHAVDLFLPVSEATAAGNGLVGSGLRYEVIPNFVTAALPLERSEEAVLDGLPDGDYLLYVGDIRKEKGVEVLLEAYAGLEHAQPLVLIGKVWPGWSPELPPKTRLLTDWPNAAVREAQRRCLALVAPSVWPEPFGMVVIETLAAGRPVIASRIGGMVELIDDGRNGMLVPPGDRAALTAALASLLDDDQLLARLAGHAPLSARRFEADEIVPLFERAYRRIIDG